MRPLSASTARLLAPRHARFHAFVLVVGILLAMLAAAPVPASAASLAEKQARAAKLDVEVAKLEDSYGDLQERWRGARVELREVQADAEDAKAKLREARGDLRGAKVRLEERALAIYRDGGGSNELVQVAQAGSVSDFFDRVDTIRRVGDQDADILGRVRTATARVGRQETRLRSARDRQAKVVRRAATARTKMGVVLEKRRETLGSVTADIRAIMEQQRAAEAAREAAASSQRAATVAAGGTLDASSGGGGAANPPGAGDTTGGQSDAAPSTSGSDAGSGGGETSSGGGDPVPSSGGGGDAPAPAASVPLPPASGSASSAASIAMSKVGTPYVYGAAGPSSFDCSGLVVWAFAQAGRGGLPHSTYSLIGMGVEVPLSQAQVGDLVFTNNAGHMGIYVGGGSIVHAPRTGRDVTVESLAYYKVISVRRI